MLKFLVILLVYTAGVRASCSESDQIECGTSSRCTRIQYVCDGDNDCGDYSDEDSELCDSWRNSDCSRGEVTCYREGYSSCVSIREFCRSSSPPCEGDFDRRICQMLNNEKLSPLADIILPSERLEQQDGGAQITANMNETLLSGDDFVSIIPHAMKHEKCPPLYTQVGDVCLSIFVIGNMTWGESEHFCHQINGELYIPASDDEFDLLTSHLREHAFQTDFWIGGNFYNNTVGWRWINGESIKLKTNHWAIIHDPECYNREVHYDYRNVSVPANDGVCYNYYQAPYVSNPFGSCVAMTFKRFYFLSDEDCQLKKSPICKPATSR